MKKYFLKNIILLFFASAALFAQTEFPSFEPDPRITKQMISLPEMDAQTFAYTALLASGASEEKIKQHSNTLELLAQKFSSSIQKNLSNEEKADMALMFIYDNILKRYKFDQTKIDEAMETGVYNCVSSDVIFIYFAKVLHIPVVAVETPKHAFCTIESDGAMIDVETTNPFGVNPGRKRTKGLPNGGKQYTVVPVKDYKGRHDIDDRRLLGIIYNNRISALQKKKADLQTIPLAVDACVLQENSQRGLLTVAECVCNYASSLTAAGKNQEGLDFVRRAQEIFGETKNYTAYIETATYNILIDEFETLPFDNAIVELDSKKEILLSKNYNTLLGYIYCQEAQRFGKKYDWKTAIDIVQNGLEKVPADVNLKKIIRVYKQNYAIDFHNRAAELYNAGDKEGARTILREGLQLIPDSALLKKDLSTMK